MSTLEYEEVSESERLPFSFAKKFGVVLSEIEAAWVLFHKADVLPATIFNPTASSFILHFSIELLLKIAPPGAITPMVSPFFKALGKVRFCNKRGVDSFAVIKLFKSGILAAANPALNIKFLLSMYSNIAITVLKQVEIL